MGINRSYKDKKDYPTRQTGNVAKLMGLSDEGVRIYERYGLVYPEKKGDGGFRAFDIMDIVMLLYARVYRECGFSLKEVQQLANDSELKHVADAYRDSITHLRRKVEWEQKRLERIEELLTEIETAITTEGQCTLDTMPGLYRVEFFRDHMLDITLAMGRKAGEWMERYVPFTMLSTRFEKDVLSLPREDIPASSGLGICEKYAAFLGIQPSREVTYHPPVRAVHTILRANNQVLNPDMSGCLSFIRTHGLEIAGDAISFGIVNLHFQTDFDRYFHLWIPVKEP